MRAVSCASSVGEPILDAWIVFHFCSFSLRSARLSYLPERQFLIEDAFIVCRRSSLECSR